MKANRKFIKGDEAVSPVIAVILMVAITVVLAATVYVWVSGFGSSGNAPAKSVALSSNGAISSGVKNFSVSAATPGLKWNDVKFTLEGVDLGYDGGDAQTASFGENEFYIYEAGARVIGTTVPTTTIDAGDSVIVKNTTALSGKTLRIVDNESNSVIYTITIG